MGFGFNLAFVFILVPLTIILLVTSITDKGKYSLKGLGLLWGGVIVLVIVSYVSQWVTKNIELDKNDYHGTYIIDRNYFAGKQADWQYEHFRFEIKDNDSILFYVTDKEKILKIYRGKISTVRPYNSDRLVLHMDNPAHHIVADNPITYRSAWSFYLVFNSNRYNNVFFKQGHWEPIESLGSH